MKRFLCLGIESTAHTFGAAVVDSKGNILSDIRNMYTTSEGGMNPTKVAEHHNKVADSIISEALTKANITPNELSLVSFSRTPGLAPCLIAGMKKTKEFSNNHHLPLVGVNHCIAHLSSGLLFTKAKDPVFVFTSGANTQIIAYEGKRFRIFGETIDTGVGNALDKFGRDIGLGFPSGPKIEEIAKKGEYIELPYSVKGMDLTFSGIVTNAINKFKQGEKIENLCFSMQETLFSMINEVTERALAHTGKKEVVLIGGVAANKRFCEMMDIMCKERKCTFYPVPLKYSGDNAAMIAWQGLLEKSKATKEYDTIDVDPRERVDETEINWF